MTKLQQQLEKNAERRTREQMLPELPDSIQHLLKNAQVRYSKELFLALAKSPFPKYEDEKLVTKDRYDLYWHVEFDRIQHVNGMLSESNISMQPPLVVYLGKGPVYLVDSTISPEEMAVLGNCLASGLVSHVFIADKSQGLIIDSYCGYLPDDRATNQEEVVYELTYYQDAEQSAALDALTRACNLG